MCIDLTGPGGAFQFDLAGWCFALELGQQYGWEPEGTILQEGQDAAARGEYPEPFAWYAGYGFLFSVTGVAGSAPAALQRCLRRATALCLASPSPQSVR
jgi:hypothetical protein